MRLTHLTRFPGLSPTACLGDLALLCGETEQARQIYAQAWQHGDRDALMGWWVLERAIDARWVQARLDELVEHLGRGRLDGLRARQLVRLLLLPFVLEGNAAEAASLLLLAHHRLPGLSMPQFSLSAVGTASEARREVVREVLRWEDAHASDAGLGLSFLRAAFVEHVPSADGPLGLGVLSRLDPICALYAALRVADRAGGSGDVAPELEERVLSELAGRLPESAESRTYRQRYAAWLGARGRAEAALAVLDGVGTTDGGGRELRQRLCVGVGRFGEAGSMALARASEVSGPAVRCALSLLGLEYLRRDGSNPAVIAELTWQVLDETPPEVATPAFLLHLFEVLEGAYIESRQYDALLNLWRSTGALEVESAAVDARWRTPGRAVEHALLAARGVVREAPNTREPLNHRFLFVARLARQDFEGAAAQLDTIEAWSASERVLRAGFHLAGVGLGSEAEQLQRARDLLEALTQTATAELLPTVMLREVFLRQGRPERAQDVLDRVIARQSDSTRAAIQTVMARERLDRDDLVGALEAARRAFQLDVLSPEVRRVYRRVAELTEQQEDLDRIALVIDDEELARRLSLSEAHGPLIADALRLSQGSEPQKKLALTKVQWLARHVEDLPLRAAVLRFGAELSWRGLGDVERASRLAREALRWSPQDPLAGRVALVLLLELGRYGEVADILLSPSPTPLLSPELARALLRGAEDRAAGDDRRRALALVRSALDVIPGEVLSEDLLTALDLLERLHGGRGEHRAIRDALERLLVRHAGRAVAAELNRRLGRLYQVQFNDRDMAIEHYRRSLDDGVDDVATLEALETLYAEADRCAELAEVLRRRIGSVVDDSDAGLLARRSGWLRTLARILAGPLADPAGARSVLDTLLIEEPGDLERVLEAVALDRALGRFDHAVDGLEHAAALLDEPREVARLHADVGVICEEQLGSEARALASFTTSFELDPTRVETFQRLEGLFQRTRRWDDLLGLINRALAVVEADPQAGYDKERLYARKAHVELNMMERPTAAVDALLSALRSNPREDRHLRDLEQLLLLDPAPRALAMAYQLRLGVLTRASQERLALLHRLAPLHTQLGEEDAAIGIYNAILEEWPSDLEAAQKVEAIYKGAERWEELVRFYQRRLETVESADAAVPLYMAVARVAERKLRDFDLAVDTYDKLLQLVPGQMEVLRSLGRLLEATRQWERLLDVSEREVRLTDSTKARAHVYFRIGTIHETARHDLPSAIAAYEAAVAHEAAYVPAIHGLREIYKRQGRWDAVIETLQREASLWGEDKEQASIHTRIAEVYWKNLGDAVSAERSLNEAIALVPEFPTAMRGLLDIYVAQGRWDEADPLAQQLTLKSESFATEVRSDLFWKRAIVARELGNTSEAVAALQIALDIDPHNADAFEAMLSWAEESVQEGVDPDADYTEFLDRFDRTLVELGDVTRRVRLIAHWGRLAESRLEIERARSRYEEAAALVPQSLEAHRPLASFLMRLRRFEEVRALWEGLLRRLAQSSVEGRRQRCEVLVELGDLHTDWMEQPERGVTLYEDASRLDPASVAILLKGAQCLFVLQRWKEAYATTQAAIDLCGDLERPVDAVLHAAAIFYLGRIVECGFDDEDKALSLYREARQLDPDDIRPVLASARLLYRAGNWIRLENMVRGAAQTVASRQSADAAVPLRMFLATAFSKVRDYPKAEDELRAIVDSGVSDEHASAAHFALVELFGRMSNGVPKALAELHHVLDLDPVNPQALRTLGEMYQAIRQHPNVYCCYEVLRCLGHATAGHERFLTEVLRQRYEWSEPPSGVLSTEELDRYVLGPLLDSPERRGLSRMGAMISGLHVTEQAPFRPLGDKHPWAAEVQADVARMLGVDADAVITTAMGPTGLALRYVNLGSTAGGKAESRVLVPVDAEAPRTPYHEAALRFQLGRALGHVALKLLPLRAVPIDELGHLIEILVRMQMGEELEEVGRVSRLAASVQRMVEYDGGRALRSAVVAMRKTGREEPVRSEAEGLARAERLLQHLDQAADRMGLLACASLCGALDTIIAVETGDDIRALDAAERRQHLTTSPRMANIVRFFVAQAHFALRPGLGYDTGAIILVG